MQEHKQAPGRAGPALFDSQTWRGDVVVEAPLSRRLALRSQIGAGTRGEKEGSSLPDGDVSLGLAGEF